MRSPRRLIAVSCAALFAPLAYPLASGRVFTKDDLAALHLPFRYLYREALRAGDSFLWTSAYHSGFYLHGEGEAGMTHPLHLLVYRLFPLGPAFNLEILATYGFMLAGGGLVLLRLGLAAEAAWFGAMVFTFSGFNLFNLMHVNHIAAVAHMPWLLLATHVLLTTAEPRHRAWAFSGVALVTASQLLIGNPQYVWMTWLAVAFMAACLRYAGAPVSRLGLLVAAGSLGALLGAVQLLPSLDFARASTRAAWSLDEQLSYSLSPLNLIQLWSPFAFKFRIHAPESEAFIVHEFIVYNGAFCTLALAWLALRWREQRRRGLVVAFAVLAALSLVLALGRYGGVYAWLAQLPGLRNFRAPARHLVLFQLALSGLAAVAFEDLLAFTRGGEPLEWRRLWPLAVPVVLSVITTIVAAVLAPTIWAAARGLSFSSAMRAGPWSVPIVAMAAVMAMAARRTRWAVPVLIALVACDQGLWGYSYAYRWGPILSLRELAANADVPAGVQRGELIAPLVVGGSSNVAVLRGLRLTPGYSGLVASSTLDEADAFAQRIAGVAWRETTTGWVRVTTSMPRARLVSTVQTSADIKADLRRIDPERVALVDAPIEGIPTSIGPHDRRGSAQVIDDRPGSIVVETTSDERQLLVTTERFHDGWRVRVDAVDQPPIRVYGDFLGCVVDPGRHRVVLTFAPASMTNGVRVSLAGVALTAVATTLLWPWRERSERATAPRVRI